MKNASDWPLFMGNVKDNLPDFVRDFPPDLAEQENGKLRPEPCRVPCQPCIIEQSENSDQPKRRENDQRPQA